MTGPSPMTTRIPPETHGYRVDCWDCGSYHEARFSQNVNGMPLYAAWCNSADQETIYRATDVEVVSFVKGR